MKEFPASYFQQFIGKRIVKITDAENADEGLLIAFEDKTYLEFKFSGCEGDILEGKLK